MLMSVAACSIGTEKTELSDTYTDTYTDTDTDGVAGAGTVWERTAAVEREERLCGASLQFRCIELERSLVSLLNSKHHSSHLVLCQRSHV